MVVGVLRNVVIAADDFVELRDGILVIALFVVRVSELVVVGVVPLAFFAFVFGQVRDRFGVLPFVEQTLTDDFVEFRLFERVRLGHRSLSEFDCFVEFAQLKVHVGLEIRHFFLVFFLILDLVELLGGRFVIVGFISHIAQIILGLRAVLG